jgi:hypothetical protein
MKRKVHLGLVGFRQPGRELGLSIVYIPAVAIAGDTQEEGEYFCANLSWHDTIILLIGVIG